MSHLRAAPAPVSLAEARARAALEREPTHFVQGALALEPEHHVDDEEDEFFGPQHTPRTALPDPQVFAGQLAQCILEVLAGIRHPAQLVRWVHPEPYAAVATAATASIRRRERSPQAPRPRLLVRSVNACEPADGVAEVSVVLQDGPRVRAMALRLVGQDGRWRVAALRLG